MTENAHTISSNPQGSSMWQNMSEFLSLLRLNNSSLNVYVIFCFSSKNGHLGVHSYSYILAILDNVATSISVQILFETQLSFLYILRIGITVSYGNSVLNFLSNYHTVFQQLLYHFTSHLQGETASVPISPHPRLLFSVLLWVFFFCFACVCVCFLFVCFDDSHPNQCEIVSHSIVHLHFPNDQQNFPGSSDG